MINEFIFCYSVDEENNYERKGVSMEVIDKFIKKIKKGIFKWIKMPKKKKLSEEDKEVLGRILEEYTWDAILKHLGLMGKSAIVSSKPLEELRELRATWRERYSSAMKRKEDPMEIKYDKNEECLKCQYNIDPDVEYSIKNQLKKVESELDKALGLE